MNTVVSKKQTIISYVIAFFFILAMVTVSVMLKDREVILPEMAAMVIAMWVYREAGWIRQPSKIFLAPSITAVIGFVVNQLPITYVGKVIFTLGVIDAYFAYHSIEPGPFNCNRLASIGDECTRMVFYHNNFNFHHPINAWSSRI